MPLTQEPLQKKLQTNSSLSAANLTAYDFWMAFFFFTSPFTFFLPRACDLSSLLCQGRLWFFPPWGIEYLVIVRGKVTATLIFHNCRPPRLHVSDPETLSCRSPWWMRRPCSSTHCWQPLHNHYSSLLTPQDLSEECPLKKKKKMWVCVGCLCQCFMVKNKLQESLTFA